MLTQVKEQSRSISISSRGKSNKPFGLSYVEILAIFVALISFIGVGIYYFSALKHEQEDLKSLKLQIIELNKVEDELKKSTTKNKEVQEDEAKRTLESLENFKSVYLKNLSQGRIALIDAINSLAKKDGVRLMSGIAMTANKYVVQSSEEKKSGKKKSMDSLGNVFPSIKINFTVAGDYKNLREFINHLEANKQFVTINSVSLTSIKDRESGSGRSSGRRAAQILSGISLAIDMTAYFQA